jgi:hypothetical protein
VDEQQDPVETASTTASTTERTTGARGKVRSVATVIVGIVAVIALLASVFALWARTVLLDSGTVGSAVEEVLADQVVATSLATFVTDQAFAALDVETRVTELLPDEIDRLGLVLVAGVRGFVIERVADAVARPEVAPTIGAIVERAHERLLRALEGDGLVNGWQIEGDEIQANLLPLLGLAVETLQDRGIATGLDLPELRVDGDPAEQIAALEAATGRDLPDDFGQLVVFSGPKVEQAGAALANAQRAVVLFERAIFLVFALALVLGVVTVVLARRRRRAVVVLAVASTVAFFVTRLLVRIVLDRAPELVLDPGARAAIAGSLESLSAGLLQTVTILAIVGLVVALATWVSGPGERATQTRARVTALRTRAA